MLRVNYATNLRALLRLRRLYPDMLPLTRTDLSPLSPQGPSQLALSSIRTRSPLTSFRRRSLYH